MADNSRGTTTHIRTIYSDLSYITIKFWNNSISLNFVPAIGKNSDGRIQYQKSSGPSAPVGQMTTLSYDSAAALVEIVNNIIVPAVMNDTDARVSIPMANNAELIIERRSDEFNQKRVLLTLIKQNQNIAYKFQQVTGIVTENGNQVHKQFESGLKMFVDTINGYLTGINSDRHLDKLTEDFAKSQENNNNQAQGNNQGQNNYNRGGSYNRGGGNYNRNNNYRNRGGYNNQQSQPQNDTPPWENNNQQQPVNINSYSIT